MSVYLDTRGRTWLGIALCDRCHRKFPIDMLWSDRNSPGLKVCEADLDELDPYRLPARAAERITLPFARPDISVATDAGGMITEDEDSFIITEDGDSFLTFFGSD